MRHLRAGEFSLIFSRFEFVVWVNEVQKVRDAGGKSNGQVLKLMFSNKRVTIYFSYLRWPLLAMEASGLGVPFRAASCCSSALDSKYSSQAAASWRRREIASKGIIRSGRRESFTWVLRSSVPSLALSIWRVVCSC